MISGRVSSFVMGLCAGIVITALVLSTPLSANEKGSLEERFRASSLAFLMAISSLAVDTELNARKLNDLSARIGKLEDRVDAKP